MILKNPTQKVTELEKSATKRDFIFLLTRRYPNSYCF
jgi:hypothetical protein